MRNFGGGAKIFSGKPPPPRNAITADLRRLVKKMWRCSKYPIVIRAAKKLHKKRNVYAVWVTFHPCAVLTPLNASYRVVHVGSYGRRNHYCTISAQSVQGLGSLQVTPISVFPIHSDHDPYNS